MDFEVKLLMSEFVTHDVRRIIVTRPDNFRFEPGQGVELAIDTPQLREQGRPFTPTSLNEDLVLEFTIKAYPAHNGVTQALHELRPGANLLMSEAFGTIQYKGPGVFIAGGAGITPFIAIVRDLARKGKLSSQGLIFSNRRPADIIYEKELRHVFGNKLVLTCTESQAPGYKQLRIDKEFLTAHIKDLDQQFYVCGPPGFMEVVNGALQELGVEPDALVFEQ
ncbi:MAG: flavodoxin reductase [Gammaproteobacteria bacterium]|jgi:cytochrome-b5 reductase|nr:flavodoxin reductase [Gammaproteobacteria bacterium]